MSCEYLYVPFVKRLPAEGTPRDLRPQTGIEKGLGGSRRGRIVWSSLMFGEEEQLRDWRK